MRKCGKDPSEDSGTNLWPRISLLCVFLQTPPPQQPPLPSNTKERMFPSICVLNTFTSF